jgi:hypothetical protein
LRRIDLIHLYWFPNMWIDEMWISSVLEFTWMN